MQVIADWRDAVRPADAGPGVAMLHLSEDLKVLLVSLQPGQSLPPHPGPAVCFHVLSGSGVAVVDGEEQAVTTGAIVIAPTGSVRSVRAVEPMVFLGNLGSPGA